MTPTKEEFIEAIARANCPAAKVCRHCRERADKIFAVIAQFATAAPAIAEKTTAGE